MVKPKGLGRGLDALLGGDTSSRSSNADAVTMLPIAALQPGKYQPRSRMDQDALNALAASIKAQGIMQPILVRPVGGGNHEIIAGERRWRAARIAGLSSVPVLVRNIPDQQALAVALIENIQREDLNALEEATGIERLINEFALTHQAVADAIGKSRTAVTNLLRLLELAPPVKTLLGEGRIEMGHARALIAEMLLFVEQPGQHLRLQPRIFRQQRGAVRQIKQNGRRFDQNLARRFLPRGHLAARIDGEESGFLLRAIGAIERRAVVGTAKLAQQQADLVAVGRVP